MALTLGTAARNAACDGVVDLVDAGSGPGKLKIQNASSVVICEIILDAPAFGPSVLGVATAQGLPKNGYGTPAAGGGSAAAKYDVTDSNDNVIWSGTIPGNMTLDNVNIAQSQVVRLTSWVHSQPAS